MTRALVSKIGLLNFLLCLFVRTEMAAAVRSGKQPNPLTSDRKSKRVALLVFIFFSLLSITSSSHIFSFHQFTEGSNRVGNEIELVSTKCLRCVCCFVGFRGRISSLDRESIEKCLRWLTSNRKRQNELAAPFFCFILCSFRPFHSSFHCAEKVKGNARARSFFLDDHLHTMECVAKKNQ